MKTNDQAEFLKLCVKLEPIEFLGLAKILKVETMQKKQDSEEQESRYIMSIVEDMAKAFAQVTRKKRRELIRILRAAASRKAN